jgi:hypothetical protein
MKQIKLKEKIETGSTPLIHCQHCAGLTRLVGSESHPVQENTDLLTYVCMDCDEASSSMVAPWLQLERSHDFFAHRARTFPKHPICPRCEVPMWLSKIRAKPKKVEYFYECNACEDKMSVTGD